MNVTPDPVLHALVDLCEDVGRLLPSTSRDMASYQRAMNVIRERTGLAPQSRRRIEEARFDHHGRPILVCWEGTPGLYSAIFEDEYDGATDSNHPVGLGREMNQAVADLIEKDEERHAPQKGES